jgi:hypothetical protein
MLIFDFHLNQVLWMEFGLVLLILTSLSVLLPGLLGYSCKCY